jgi:stage V sporulation protein K
MSFYKKIEAQLHQYNIDPAKIIPGNRPGPIEILKISGLFPSLNLKHEEILLVFKKENQVWGLLSNEFLYIPNEQATAVADINQDVLVRYFSLEEAAFIRGCIDQYFNLKKESTKTLDDFLAKYKGLVENEEKTEAAEMPYFDAAYLEMLDHEAGEALKLCLDLNGDANFVQGLNRIFSPGEQAFDGYRAEHLLLADLIKAYNESGVAENEKSKFTLAFFFEVLQGNNLAKSVTLARLNEMVSKPSFNENIGKIKNAVFFQMPAGYEDVFILPQVLHKLNHTMLAKSGNLIYRFASIVCKADGIISEQEKTNLKKILDKTTQFKPDTASPSHQTVIPEGDSLELVMKELNELVGLDEVKKSISDLINFLKISRIRAEKELASLDVSLHSVFLGPPGTGKTTVARLLGRIYKHLDYLSKGQMVETDRAGMVAGYVGQTALKVDELVNQSKGGVLFIDEAYSLTNTDNTRDFGSEAVDALLKRMEDNRKDLVVVVAGYTEPMKYFIESNPGLRSRFNRYYEFNHFLPQQLLQIFQSFCSKYDFKPTPDAEDKLLATFELLYEKRDAGFGNARVVRNLFEQFIQNQANRIVALPEINEEILQTLTEEDVAEPKLTVQKVFLTVNQEE